jgi:hypothetical protein
MSEKTRAYEKKRYARDRKKRIAAEEKWQAGNEEYRRKHRQRAKEQAKGKLPPESAKCPNCGKTGGRKERHHTTYKGKGKTEIRCSKCNPRPGK